MAGVSSDWDRRGSPRDLQHPAASDDDPHPLLHRSPPYPLAAAWWCGDDLTLLRSLLRLAKTANLSSSSLHQDLISRLQVFEKAPSRKKSHQRIRDTLSLSLSCKLSLLLARCNASNLSARGAQARTPFALFFTQAQGVRRYDGRGGVQRSLEGLQRCVRQPLGAQFDNCFE
mgnify:CR=1 FL=1